MWFGLGVRNPRVLAEYQMEWSAALPESHVQNGYAVPESIAVDIPNEARTRFRTRLDCENPSERAAFRKPNGSNADVGTNVKNRMRLEI